MIDNNFKLNKIKFLYRFISNKETKTNKIYSINNFSYEYKHIKKI